MSAPAAPAAIGAPAQLAHHSPVVGGASRRPLATTAATTAHAALAANSDSRQQQPPPAAPTASKSPQMPRLQSNKPDCPSPPPILKDRKSTLAFRRGNLLGEGGFAKCYEAFDQQNVRHAAKVVPKVSLKSEKQKQKLFTEIKIHQNLKHPNIVRFQHVFEDASNVYMILEVCDNRTLVDMMKRRKRLSEAESRYYLKQLLDALAYMHSKRVIHRDLKLGNLFLTKSMDIKVGDFGLATVVKTDGERKRTICGTPNYIAPEILFGREHGHSFEVDMWSLGVIMYTMIIGRPPFQTKEIKEIYRNIRENRYQFPSTVPISEVAVDLIRRLLSNAPDQRPSIHETLSHPWFGNEIPRSIPVTALTMAPTFSVGGLAAGTVKQSPLRAVTSSSQQRRVLEPHHSPLAIAAKAMHPGTAPTHIPKAQIVEIQQDENARPPPSQRSHPSSSQPQSTRHAPVVPPSPKPLSQQQPPSTSRFTRPSRASSPPRPQAPASSRSSVPTSQPAPASRLPSTSPTHVSPTPQSHRQQPPSSASIATPQSNNHATYSSPVSQAAAPPAPAAARNAVAAATVSSPARDQLAQATTNLKLSPLITTSSSARVSAGGTPRRSMLESMHWNLKSALGCVREGRGCDLPNATVPRDQVVAPRVFISKWIDYSNKYGLGYQLTNGAMGVYFNDSTSIILSADDVHFEYLEYARGTDKTVMNRHAHKMGSGASTDYPAAMKKKVTLLSHFKNYMNENLYKASQYTFVDKENTHGMDFLVKYMRTKHAIMFRLTNRIVQINFFDHSKLILSKDGLVVTFIDRDRQIHTMALSAVVDGAVAKGGRGVDRHADVISRLKYARDILETLVTKQQSQQTSQSQSNANGGSSTHAPAPMAANTRRR